MTQPKAKLDTRFEIRLTTDTLKYLKYIAKQQNSDVSKIIRDLIDKEVKGLEQIDFSKYI